MRPENQRMQKFLADNGIKAIPKYMWKGSLKGSWRLSGGNYPFKAGFAGRVTWTDDLCQKLTDLGFLGHDYKPLNQYSGNGGMFQVFVRGHRLEIGWMTCLD